ncbi:hypothetical protein JCM8097_000104 [Rhodosporidiobolus ruineniae]
MPSALLLLSILVPLLALLIGLFIALLVYRKIRRLVRRLEVRERNVAAVEPELGLVAPRSGEDAGGRKTSAAAGRSRVQEVTGETTGESDHSRLSQQRRPRKLTRPRPQSRSSTALPPIAARPPLSHRTTPSGSYETTALASDSISLTELAKLEEEGEGGEVDWSRYEPMSAEEVTTDTGEVSGSSAGTGKKASTFSRSSASFHLASSQSHTPPSRASAHSSPYATHSSRTSRTFFSPFRPSHPSHPSEDSSDALPSSGTDDRSQHRTALNARGERVLRRGSRSSWRRDSGAEPGGSSGSGFNANVRALKDKANSVRRNSIPLQDEPGALLPGEVAPPPPPRAKKVRTRFGVGDGEESVDGAEEEGEEGADGDVDESDSPEGQHVVGRGSRASSRSPSKTRTGRRRPHPSRSAEATIVPPRSQQPSPTSVRPPPRPRTGSAGAIALFSSSPPAEAEEALPSLAPLPSPALALAPPPTASQSISTSPSPSPGLYYRPSPLAGTPLALSPTEVGSGQTTPSTSPGLVVRSSPVAQRYDGEGGLPSLQEAAERAAGQLDEEGSGGSVFPTFPSVAPLYSSADLYSSPSTRQRVGQPKQQPAAFPPQALSALHAHEGFHLPSTFPISPPPAPPRSPLRRPIHPHAPLIARRSPSPCPLPSPSPAQPSRETSGGSRWGTTVAEQGSAYPTPRGSGGAGGTGAAGGGNEGAPPSGMHSRTPSSGSIFHEHLDFEPASPLTRRGVVDEPEELAPLRPREEEEEDEDDPLMRRSVGLPWLMEGKAVDSKGSLVSDLEGRRRSLREVLQAEGTGRGGWLKPTNPDSLAPSSLTGSNPPTEVSLASSVSACSAASSGSHYPSEVSAVAVEGVRRDR